MEQGEEQVVASGNKPKRDEHGRLLPGGTANPNGRPILTLEEKLLKKSIKEFVEEHKQSLAESLPKISPALIKKAIGGDVPAIKEIHDRVMGKPTQPIEHSGGVSFSEAIKKGQFDE